MVFNPLSATGLYQRTGCRDGMVVGFISTYAISAYHHYRCEFTGVRTPDNHALISIMCLLRYIYGALHTNRVAAYTKI
jgi:hypothetical protein